MENESELETIDLLKSFIHENEDLEKLEEIVEDFNIFTALGIVQAEIRHSNFLSWLMNPRETHGIGYYFLSQFLKEAANRALSLEIEGPSIFDIDSWDLGDTEILREHRNIDILIRSEINKFVGIIENKIYSKEHSQQLQRYFDIVNREYPEYKKMYVYLTVEGIPPEEDNHFIPMSYGEIIPIIDHLLNKNKTKMASELLTFISHYVEMLRRYIMKDSEIQELCRAIYKRHQKALDLIYEYKPDKLMEIRDHLINLIGGDSELIVDSASKSYILFTSKNLDFIPKKGEAWAKSGRILLFNFSNDTNGVNLYLIIGPGPQEIREKLYKIGKGNPQLFNKSNRTLTKQWFSIYKKSIIRKKDYEDKEGVEIKKILGEKLEKFKLTDLVKIESEIMEHY